MKFQEVAKVDWVLSKQNKKAEQCKTVAGVEIERLGSACDDRGPSPSQERGRRRGDGS